MHHRMIFMKSLDIKLFQTKHFNCEVFIIEPPKSKMQYISLSLCVYLDLSVRSIIKLIDIYTDVSNSD